MDNAFTTRQPAKVGASKAPTGFICGPRIYKYKGWFFEVHSYCGPWPLKKDGELRKRAGRVFWKVWASFDKLSKEDQEKHREGGGCLAF